MATVEDVLKVILEEYQRGMLAAYPGRMEGGELVGKANTRADWVSYVPGYSLKSVEHNGQPLSKKDPRKDPQNPDRMYPVANVVLTATARGGDLSTFQQWAAKNQKWIMDRIVPAFNRPDIIIEWGGVGPATAAPTIQTASEKDDITNGLKTF